MLLLQVQDGIRRGGLVPAAAPRMPAMSDLFSVGFG